MAQTTLRIFFILTVLKRNKEQKGVQWKLDLANTDVAENLYLKDTLQKTWLTNFNF